MTVGSCKLACVITEKTIDIIHVKKSNQHALAQPGIPYLSIVLIVGSVWFLNDQMFVFRI